MRLRERLSGRCWGRPSKDMCQFALFAGLKKFLVCERVWGGICLASLCNGVYLPSHAHGENLPSFSLLLTDTPLYGCVAQALQRATFV